MCEDAKNNFSPQVSPEKVEGNKNFFPQSCYLSQEKSSSMNVAELFNSSGAKSSTSSFNGSIKIPQIRRNSIGAPKIADNSSSLLVENALSIGVSFRRMESTRAIKGTQGVKEILEHPQCCGLFKEFLDRECSSQTLHFLLEVEDYRRIPNIKFQLTKAKKIFHKYLHEFAIMKVPVSQQTKEAVVKNLDEQIQLPIIFKAAAEEVLTYIDSHQFPRFQRLLTFSCF